MIKKAVYNLVTSVHPVNPYHFTVTNHTLDQLPLIGSGSTTHSGFSISDATGLKINQHRPGREVLQLPQFRKPEPDAEQTHRKTKVKGGSVFFRSGLIFGVRVHIQRKHFFRMPPVLPSLSEDQVQVHRGLQRTMLG